MWPLGHGNAIHVVWPAKRDGHSVIRYAGSTDGGRTFSPAVTVAGATLTGAARLARPHARTRRRCPRGLARRPERRRRRRTRHGTAGVQEPGPKPARSGGGPRQDIFHASWKGNGARSERLDRGKRLLLLQDRCRDCRRARLRRVASYLSRQPARHRRRAFDRQRRDLRAPIRVSEDGWKIDACPDDGPAMVADGHGGIHIAWPTLVAGDVPRKGIFYSTLAGDGFAPRHVSTPASPQPAHPQIASSEHRTRPSSGTSMRPEADESCCARSHTEKRSSR